MQKYNFVGKKIGIWGAGIVGQSAINFFLQSRAKIQLLNKKIVQGLNPQIEQILQSPNTIQSFFEDNDYILPSPGIPLHDYRQFHHKVIAELDIIQQEYDKPVIAITGTAGKTTITHILQKVLNRYKPTIAAGNIGYPMLNLLTQDHQEKVAIIETSSFQLQHIKQFAPEITIITNFFENHLDHHQSKNEYFEAKTNIFARQIKPQKTLLPLSIAKEKINIKSDLYTFGESPPQKESAKHFYIEGNQIIFASGLTKTKLCDTTKLPTYTFLENWLIIIATLHINNIVCDDALYELLHKVTLPEHRLSPVCTINGATFYNDSKSTIWQSTAQAIDQLEKPLYLFLGGLSKGVDRAPLIEKIAQKKDITIFAFGKEAEQIKKMCNKKRIATFSALTLEESFQQCVQNIDKAKSILFSPGGSSFDLFKNYKQRGQAFEQLLKSYKQK